MPVIRPASYLMPSATEIWLEGGAAVLRKGFHPSSTLMAESYYAHWFG